MKILSQTFDAFAEDIRRQNEQFLAATMNDPDMKDKSAEFKAGYAQGWREGIAAGCVAFMRHMTGKA